MSIHGDVVRGGKRVAAAVLILAFGAGLALAGDQEQMQGRWTSRMGPDQAVTVLLEIQGDKARMTFQAPGQEPVSVDGRVVVDETASPRTLDWVDFKRADGEQAPVNRAIYRLEGDVLTVLNGGPGNARPQAFPAASDPAPGLAVFRREGADPSANGKPR